MQEEVENRTVNLAISTSKLTAHSLVTAFQKYMRHRNEVKAKKGAKKAEIPHGKQTVKQLIGQNQGVSNIEIADTDIRGFEKYAKKYGVDYAIKKDRSVDPPKYLVFFKARDSDALTSAFRDYSAATLQKQKKLSVLAQLKKFKALVKSIPDKVRNKDKEQSR